MKASEVLLATMPRLKRDDVKLGMCIAINDVLDVTRSIKHSILADSIRSEYLDLFEPDHFRTGFWGLHWVEGLAESYFTQGFPCTNEDESLVADREELLNCRLLALGFAAAMAQWDEEFLSK